ncbi:MAG: class I SAM-dependent methyltransferase [Isosphaera sp.]|nr:class I SAM-dependent methyltransferase [Isosphaera sp.]
MGADVTPDFDALAPHYRWLEAVTFGPLLHRCRTALLPHLAGCRRALVLGDGNGRFLADLLRANPDLTADALDISPGMTALARRRVGGTGRVRFRVADARAADFPRRGYDLIATNFFLDCFTRPELRRLVPRLADALEPGGRWAVGDFRLPDRGWPRLAGRVALAGMYAFFRLATRLPAGRLVDPDPLIRACGLAPGHTDTWLGGFLSARLWVK